jgi:hypothetical protein
VKYHALIDAAGKTAPGIEFPYEVVTALGPTKKPPVRVTINGYTYRSTVATLGGRFMVGVSNEVRASAGVAAGDEVDVEMVLDTAPREVAVPAELATEMAADPAARQAFAALSYSRQRLLVDPVANAKTIETRDRNIAKALGALREGGG